MLDYNGFEVYWDGHASVRVVDEGFTVAVDPYGEVSPVFDADLILITHADKGHYDPEKLGELCTESTCIVVPESMSEEDIPCTDIEYVGAGEVIDVYGIEVETVPMRTEDHEDGEGFGYRFVMRDNSFYVAGDTGLIEEMWDLEGRVDVCFLPVEGVHTMDIEEAVKTAVRIKPDVAVPYHHGEPFFTGEADTQGFKAELEDRSIRCEVLDPSGRRP